MRPGRVRSAHALSARARALRRAASVLGVVLACACARRLVAHSPSALATKLVLDEEPTRDYVVNAREVGTGVCGATTGTSTELDGAVVRWGSEHVVADATACCEACSDANGCNVWVWCSDADGCGGDRKFGECWLKKRTDAAKAMSAALVRRDRSRWTSGALFSEAEATEAAAEARLLETARAAVRDAKGNQRVYLDVAIDEEPAKRIEFVLYAEVSPLASENFRRMCALEPSAEYTWVGSKFYRILDRFIDQTGPQGITGSAVNPNGTFDDDKGGLQLKHDRPGLLSVANAGPNTNTGHFSIVMAPAPHLDGSYVIFGEVVSGLEHAWAINALATESGDPSPRVARITAAGVLETSS